ncbi:MAG: hypothetical protein ABI843_15915 [Dokdonella sp.]
MKIVQVIALAGALLAAQVAATEKAAAINKADTRESFAAAAADVRKQMDTDGRYAYVRPDEREKVEADLAEMGRLFEQHDAVAQMDKAMQVKLFNAQESVNAILTLRDRDRLICERGAQTGSRIVGTSCRTYGDIEASRQASNKFMLERNATPCVSNCTGK